MPIQDRRINRAYDCWQSSERIKAWLLWVTTTYCGLKLVVLQDLVGTPCLSFESLRRPAQSGRLPIWSCHDITGSSILFRMLTHKHLRGCCPCRCPRTPVAPRAPHAIFGDGQNRTEVGAGSKKRPPGHSSPRGPHRTRRVIRIELFANPHKHWVETQFTFAGSSQPANRGAVRVNSGRISSQPPGGYGDPAWGPTCGVCGEEFWRGADSDFRQCSCGFGAVEEFFHGVADEFFEGQVLFAGEGV